MPKVVLNRSFGGFCLSEEAYKELGLKWDGYGIEYRPTDRRTAPELIEVVERLGNRVNGQTADLGIVVVPDGVDWEIEEYDGQETIRELPHAPSWQTKPTVAGNWFHRDPGDPNTFSLVLVTVADASKDGLWFGPVAVDARVFPK